MIYIVFRRQEVVPRRTVFFKDDCSVCGYLTRVWVRQVRMRPPSKSISQGASPRCSYVNTNISKETSDLSSFENLICWFMFLFSFEVLPLNIFLFLSNQEMKAFRSLKVLAIDHYPGIMLSLLPALKWRPIPPLLWLGSTRVLYSLVSLKFHFKMVYYRKIQVSSYYLKVSIQG